jgi:ABC-type multidrug transport system fused ATPase/permease subunit
MRAVSKDETAAKPEKSKRVWELLPDILEFIGPRRGLLAGGFALMVINRASGLVLPGSSKFLIDNVIIKRQIHLLLPLVLAVIGSTTLQGITDYSLTQLLSKEAQRLIAELRRRVQVHVGRLPVVYYDSNKTGTLVARIMTDVEGVRNLIGTGLVQFVGGLMTATFALFVLLKISAFMTLVAAVILLSFGLFMRKAFGILRPIFRARSKINAEVTGRLTESLGGVRVVKGYHAEEREAQVFAGGVERLLQNVLKSLTTMSVMSLAGTAALGVVSALIMFLGARQIVTGTMTLGTFVTYTMFLGLLIAPVVQVVNIGTQLSEAMAGLERTREVLNERPEDEDPRRSQAVGPVQGKVVFDRVSFAYDEGKTVLNEVSFKTEPDTVTALVGPSGAGKSTIIGLICAFHVPTAGRVLVDGVDLATARLDSYRTQLGVVLQETFLFDGTIRENVAFSRPEATEEQILAACSIARVNEFAENFEKKYDTVVGERGVKLSGGQRQRVSIARAILADPRILILDEATSSLDSESEAMIQEGLAYLMRGRTTFVIAHRLSTIRRADQILVVEGGRIIERGTHASLYGRGGRYFDLYTKQHGVESNLFLAPGEGDETVPEKESEPENEPALPNPIRLLRGRDS